MTITAIIRIDEDRWAKNPYGVVFDDAECNLKYGKRGLKHRHYCDEIIQKARADGFNIVEIKEVFY